MSTKTSERHDLDGGIFGIMGKHPFSFTFWQAAKGLSCHATCLCSRCSRCGAPILEIELNGISRQQPTPPKPKSKSRASRPPRPRVGTTTIHTRTALVYHHTSTCLPPTLPPKHRQRNWADTSPQSYDGWKTRPRTNTARSKYPLPCWSVAWLVPGRPPS